MKNLKVEQNNINNMTKFDDVKKKIENLTKEENCAKLKKGVKELHTFLETIPIKKVFRKSYIDFYEVLGYDENGNEIIGEKIGKISIQEYKQHKKKIEALRKEANIEELKTYLEK